MVHFLSLQPIIHQPTYRTYLALLTKLPQSHIPTFRSFYASIPICLLKLLKRSPPLARPQPEKHPQRRRKPERRPQLPLEIRKSGTRRGRKLTLRTSTKVNTVTLVPLKPTTDSSNSVLKQVHPDTGISNRAMSILNSFVNGTFQNPEW